MTDDCVYEVKNTGERLEGWDSALQFYKGILDVADTTATQEAPSEGIDQVGKQVRLEWVIYFSWNPDQKKFEGETIYSIRPLSS